MLAADEKDIEVKPLRSCSEKYGLEQVVAIAWNPGNSVG